MLNVIFCLYLYLNLRRKFFICWLIKKEEERELYLMPVMPGYEYIVISVAKVHF